VRVPALEKNVLKYRALQMVMVIFHAESLKRYVIESIRSTDRILPSEDGAERLPDGVTKLVKKAFAVLLEEGILTLDESRQVQKLVDYRNDIAHRVHELTGDVVLPNRTTWLMSGLESKCQYEALDRLKRFRRKIEDGLRSSFAQSLSLDSVHFEVAEATYLEELSRLEKRIDRQMSARMEAGG